MGKNRASRQQDAHGPEKDDWLDPGNGEREGEEGEILHHSCVRIEKKKSCFEARINVLLLFPQAVKRWRGSLPQQGLSAVVAGTAISTAVITASRHFVLMPERS